MDHELKVRHYFSWYLIVLLEAMVSFMLEQSLPPASEIDAKQLKQALDSNDYTVILQTSESSEIDEFQNVAKKMRKYVTFSYTKDKLLDSAADT